MSKLAFIGILIILLSVVGMGIFYGRLYILRLTFDSDEYWPAAQDITPDFDEPEEEIEPVSREFGLVIPRIDVNVPVLADISGSDNKEYFSKLQNGVGHLAGTHKPNEGDNTVILGNSSFIPGWLLSDYNEAFLLLDKMEKGNRISVYFENREYKYEVEDIKEAAKDDHSIFENTDRKLLTLVTCWPPGTDAKRLVVTVKSVE